MAPARKKAKKTSAKSSTQARSQKARSARKHSKPGIYTVPRGHVLIAVPPFWTLRQTNDDLEIEAPSKGASVIVTAFKHDPAAGPVDARDFLARFLETAPHNGRTRIAKGTRQKATASYRDPDGDNWQVMFLSNGKTLLMATCNITGPLTGREARTGVEVLESLKLKGRE
jgi:hypothetical protein